MHLDKERYNQLYWFDGADWYLHTENVDMFVLHKQRYYTLLYYDGSTYLGVENVGNEPVAYRMTIKELSGYGIDEHFLKETLRQLKLNDLTN